MPALLWKFDSTQENSQGLISLSTYNEDEDNVDSANIDDLNLDEAVQPLYTEVKVTGTQVRETETEVDLTETDFKPTETESKPTETERKLTETEDIEVKPGSPDPDVAPV